MTFAVRTFMGAASGGPINFSLGVSNTSAGVGVRSGAANMISDGTSTSTQHGVSGQADSPWYSPAPTTGAATPLYAKVSNLVRASTTITGGGFTSNALTNSVFSLSGGTGWGFTSSASNQEGTGSFTVTIYADAGGTQVLATGSVSWDVGYTP